MRPAEAPSLAPEVSAEVRAAQDALRLAVQKSALTGDPMHSALEALSAHLGAQHAMHVDASHMLTELIRRAQQPVSDETIRRLEQAAVTGADRRAFGIIREHWRRNVMLAGGVLFGVAVAFGAVGVAGGYAWGRANALSSVRQTDAALSQMFRDGPDAAATWLNLALWNDPRKALAQCGSGNTSTENGRKACMVPLWVAPPPAPAR